MGEGLRVPPGPATHRGEAISFRFNGRRIDAHEGETLGAALHAEGERVLMRSIKYHRPRGLFCNAGACASCLVRVDGVPNVRACTTPARDGLDVRTQNSFPSARRDFYAVIDKVYRRSFDHHRKFIHPRWLTPLYHRVIRKMAGFGDPPEMQRLPPRRPDVHRIDTDVVVVGAGPAGLSAAVAAAEGAARVLLVDENLRAGGSLLLTRGHLGDHDGTGIGERDGVDVARELRERYEEAGGRFLGSSVAIGCYRSSGTGEELPAPGILAVMTPQRLVEVHAKSLVVATGYHETPPMFAGNDLPGVMGSRAALTLLHRHGILPGRRVLVAADTLLAQRAARDVEHAGAQVIGIVGTGAWKGARILEARGGNTLQSVVLDIEGTQREEIVDTLLTAGGETPRIELLQQAGARLGWDGKHYTTPVQDAATSVPGVYAVGDVLGIQDPAKHLQDGPRAGEAAARHARGLP